MKNQYFLCAIMCEKLMKNFTLVLIHLTKRLKGSSQFVKVAKVAIELLTHLSLHVMKSFATSSLKQIFFVLWKNSKEFVCSAMPFRKDFHFVNVTKKLSLPFPLSWVDESFFVWIFKVVLDCRSEGQSSWVTGEKLEQIFWNILPDVIFSSHWNSKSTECVGR